MQARRARIGTRAEPDLRSLETDDDAFADWKKCSLLSERTFRLKTLLALWRRDANIFETTGGAMLDKRCTSWSRARVCSSENKKAL